MEGRRSEISIVPVWIGLPIFLFTLLLSGITGNDTNGSFVDIDKFLNMTNQTIDETEFQEFMDIDMYMNLTNETVQRIKVINVTMEVFREDYEVIHRGDYFILLSSEGHEAEITKDAFEILSKNESLKLLVKSEDGFESLDIDKRDLGRIIREGAEKIYVDIPMTAVSVEVAEAETVIEDDLVICLLDTGIYEEDDNGHGTRMASYIYSAAPNAEIISVKALDSAGVGYSSEIIEGIEECRENDVDVIVMAFGGGRFDSHCDYDPVAEAANDAASEGIRVIATERNEEYLTSPACGSSVIAIDSVEAFLNRTVDASPEGETVVETALMKEVVELDNNYIEMGAAHVYPGDESFSAEAWIRTDDMQDGIIVSTGEYGMLESYWSMGKSWSEYYAPLYIRINDGSGEIFNWGTRNLADGKWHYVVFVRDRAARRVLGYVDGELDLEFDDTTGQVEDESDELMLGNSDPYQNEWFNGDISAVGTYAYAFSAEEVKARYSASLAQYEAEK